jgi:hypothetical protein
MHTLAGGVDVHAGRGANPQSAGSGGTSRQSNFLAVRRATDSSCRGYSAAAAIFIVAYFSDCIGSVNGVLDLLYTGRVTPSPDMFGVNPARPHLAGFSIGG